MLNKIIVFKYLSKSYPSAHILVIDPSSTQIIKDYNLETRCRIEKIFSKDDRIHLIIQPYKKELNFSYYLLFWMPRGKPSKWDYFTNGNKWEYIFDKDFTIVQKKELQ